MSLHKTAVIVEDDPDIRHLIVEVLEAAGFSTVSVGNGVDGVRAVLSYQPLITTLDVNMPGIDGFEAARRIRAQSDTYIIMITGLEEEADVVLGLGAGADEYVVKPFRPRELRARVESLLRRPRSGTVSQGAAPRQDAAGSPSGMGDSMGAGIDERIMTPAYPAPALPGLPAQGQPTPGLADQSGQPATDSAVGTDPTPSGQTPPVGAPGWVVHRDLAVNVEYRTALIDGRELTLTRTEFDLLATLIESKRRVRSKADLTLVLRGESYVTSYFVGESDKRAIEAHMTNLRRKLGDNANQPRYIETVRGVGYRMTAEVAATA
ncbi:response regulator [Microbacterium sp. 179-B 1A2 NHS]|uniref:response regulator transcription factor n=1 Tax=Microbacterium sp. 179-B 1A2 NHS TaxID=3142383 RepID=UPI0039A1473B